MADRRENLEDGSRAKRQKTSGADMDPSSNPYLAHMYGQNGTSNNGYRNGYGSKAGSGGSSEFKRHSSTATQAKEAEDGPKNFFNGTTLSSRYFGILKTRRNLPVHAQRLVFLAVDAIGC